MHMHGTVRLQVVVGFNGSVKSSVILGGSPVLAEAASAAVSKWRFEPGPSETKEIIQFLFQTE
jgi:TonB family protein